MFRGEMADSGAAISVARKGPAADAGAEGRREPVDYEDALGAFLGEAGGEGRRWR